MKGKKPKPHSDTNELLLLIRIRREAAWEAMRLIVERFSTPPHLIPSVSLLGDYLLNMVFCLELMLKVLANYWDDHDMKHMYKQVFGRPHPVPGFLKKITSAICDQKYLYEPACGLAEHLPDLERLYDELNTELGRKHPSLQVVMRLQVPTAFAEYIRDNPTRFVSIPCPAVQGAGPPAADVQMQVFEKYQEFVSGVQASFGRHVSAGRQFEFGTLQIAMVNP